MLSLAFAQAAAPIVSEASNIPYLPTAIWVLVVSMSLVVVLVTLAIYRWYDMRVKAVVEDGATVADLVAQKTGLEAKLEDDRKWLKECKDELLSVQAERQEQQQLRQELAGLSMEAAQYEQKIDGLRQVESGLQNVVSTLGQDRDRLTAEKDTLDKSIEKLETAKRVAETDQQRAETEAKRAEQEFQSIAGRYQEEKDRLDSLVQDIAGKEVQQQGLNREIASTTERCFLLRDELLKLEAERREQEILRKELETMQGEVTQHEQRVGDLRSTASELQNAISTFTQNRDHLLQDQERLTAEKTTLEQAKADAEAVASAAAESQRRAVAEAERARQEMQEVTRNLGDLLRDISEREIKQQTLIHESIALSARLSDLQKEMLTTEERLARVRDDLAPLEEIFAQKKQAQRERDELLEERRTLQEAVGSLKRERASLEGIEAVSRYADLLEMPPECLADDRFSGGELEERDEAEALFELQENLREQGLFFADRILKAFHTSLKVNQINPLTVLAGVSGTGKSRLPIEYAQAMGMHSLIVSVQPRWDSPQDLFGFYN